MNSDLVSQIMPLYEYQCEKCQKIEEVIQKFSDAPATTCSFCQGPVKKLMSMNSFALQGTGWYTSDYKRKDSSSESAPKKGAGKSE